MLSIERTPCRVLGMGVLSGALIMFGAGMAGAESASDEQVDQQLREMREMVLKLQDTVESQQRELDSQAGVIRSAGIEEEKSTAASALSSFLETTNFSGSIATSYFYNTNDPGSGERGGNSTISSPFHPDHNTIQFDELWFSGSREASDETRVGFQFDVVFGSLADTQGARDFSEFRDGDDEEVVFGASRANGNDVWIPAAYLDYKTPFGPTLTAGKFGTHIGYEVAGAAYNATITRGFTYSLLQPVSQIGVKLAGDLGPVGWMIGATNGLGPNQNDIDGAKDFIWQLSGGNDMVSLVVGGEWGGDAEFFGGNNDDNALVIDTIIEVTPSDALVAWLNLTYANVQEAGAKDPWGVGLALGARAGLTDRAGLTGRFEYGHGNNEGGATALVVMPAAGTEADLIAVTGVFDYLLTDGLTFKTEVKWEKILDIAGASDNVFDGEDNQVVVGAQLVLAF